MNRMVKKFMVVLLSAFMFLGAVTTPVQAKGDGYYPTSIFDWIRWWQQPQPEEPTEPAPEETPAETEEPSEETEEEVAETEQPAEEAEEETSAADETVEVTEPAQEEVSYPAVVLESGDELEDIVVTVDAPEEALPEGVTMDVKKVSLEAVQAAVNNTENVSGTVVTAVDITFYDADGNVFEPLKEINVKITSAEIADPENAQVVHLDTTADEIEAAEAVEVEAEPVEAELTESTATFNAENFSIYAVIEGSTDEEARATVYFYGKDKENPVETFYVKNSDVLLGTGTRENNKSYLEDIVYDPGVGTLDNNEVFRGWTLTESYDENTQAMDIDAIRHYLADLSITEGMEVKIYAMIFKTITVTYLGEGNVSLGSETIVTAGTSIDYTVSMSYTPATSTQNFEGWKVNAGGDFIEGYTAGTVYKNGTSLKISGNVTFSVDAPTGHWLVFDEVEKGATYVSPKFIKDGETTKQPTETMTLTGYTFDDWYVDKDYSEKFTFGNTLPDNKTVYAKWDPNTTAPYTILIWKQNVSGNGYDFVETVTGTGNVNSNIPLGNTTSRNYTGFHLKETPAAVKIVPEGNAVTNVYYDRTEYTLTFQAYSNRAWRTVKTIKALYGQNISSNFPIVGSNGTSYAGYVYEPQNSSVFTTGDVPTLEVMPAENTTFHIKDYGGGRTYHLYYYLETLNGQTGDVSYGGKNYIEHQHVQVNASSLQSTKSEDFFDIDGFTQYTSNPSYGSNGKANFDNNRSIRLYYSRDSYKILYMDGVYVDGNNNPIDEKKEATWGESPSILYQADISSYNKNGSNYYTPEKANYVFDGWYLDEACVEPCTFTTMPKGGIKVYAKWRQIQYRVFLHPNAGTDSTLSWGKNEQGQEVNQEMNFRISLGGKVSAPTGTRQEYEMVGWYLDEACTQVFNADAYVLNNDSVKTPYDKTKDFTDPMDKWGNGATTNADVDRPWITRKLDLYAKWRAVLIGAEGIGVIYDANGGGKAPTDSLLYKDSAGAIAQGASTAPEGKQFLYWVVQTWDENEGKFVDTDTLVYPGDTFTVLKANARVVENEGSTEEKPSFTYTVQLRAEYGDAQQHKPTHIDWYKNDVNPSEVLQSDKNLQINQAIDIYKEIPVNTGYKFLGWAREPEYEIVDGEPQGDPITYYAVDEDDLFLKYDAENNKYQAQNKAGEWVDVTQIAADEALPYHAMYAVWEYVGVFYVYHSSDATVDTIDMANDLTDGKYDLCNAVKADYLYGGYFKKYFDVTDEKAIAAAKNNTAVDTVKPYIGDKLYDRVDGKIVRYWSKSNAYTADGSALVPVKDTVYYLREIPTDYLGLRVQTVYSWDKNNTIDDLYLITTVDNNIYKEAGFKVETDNKAAFYASYSIQSRGSSKVTKIVAKDINGIGGYVGVWDGTSTLITNADENSEFTVLPYWITLDNIRVDDTRSPRTFNIGDKTFGNESGSMYEVKNP